MSFQVSQEFQALQAQTAQAFQEASEAEHRATRGSDLPIGTRGVVTIVSGSAGQTKPKVVNGQPQPGKPFVTLEFEYQTPEAVKGKKASRYFDLAHHEKYPMAQKVADLFDFLEDAGMPKELRKESGSDISAIGPWISSNPSFNFIVVAGYQGRGEIKPTPAVDSNLPSADSTNSLLGPQTGA